MTPPAPLAAVVLEKVNEQLERIQHLLMLMPSDRLRWRPELETEALTLGAVIGHLLECLAGVCAVLYAAHPGELSHFARLKEQPVNHECAPAEATERIQTYRLHIEEGFARLSDVDLARRIPTLFVSDGEPLLTLLLGNLEHLVNHKYQLFFYLKMLGVRVGTPDLYRFRGPS